MKLYEIAEDFRKLFDSLSDDGLSGEQLAKLDELNQAFDTKVENCCRALRNLEAECDAVKAEEARFKKRKQALENNIKTLRGYMHHCLVMANETDVHAGPFIVSVVGTAPKVVIEKEFEVPGEFFTYEPKLSKSDIKAALEANEDVPGCRLEAGSTLKIR